MLENPVRGQIETAVLHATLNLDSCPPEGPVI